MTLRSDGGVLDAQDSCRHFLVQGDGELELEGVHLINGRGKGSGGAILARSSATVRLHNLEIENSRAVGVVGIDGGKARGGAIAVAATRSRMCVWSLGVARGTRAASTRWRTRPMGATL